MKRTKKLNCKHIAVLTGTRAEYGLLRPVIKRLLSQSELKVSVLVTGAHLSKDFGYTVNEIKADNIPIAAEFDILTHGTGVQALPQTVADAICQFSAWFIEHKPDMFVLLGDRYEAFAAAQAAAMCDVPIAHISGGDVTLGAADDYYRHCITKMSKLHFPSCEAYANRVIRMGEAPSTVFNVGGLGDQNIREMQKCTLEELSQSVDFDLTKPFGLVTFHPETAGEVKPKEQMQALLDAMQSHTKSSGLNWLITKANADAGGAELNAMIDNFAQTNKNTCLAVQSLGVKRYLSAMQFATLVAGNSSSGVVETPTFGVPTLNIGARQAGRLICDNVLNVNAEKTEIINGFKTLCSDDFIKKARQTISPYSGGDTAGKIVEQILASLKNNDITSAKAFYDEVQNIQIGDFENENTNCRAW